MPEKARVLISCSSIRGIFEAMGLASAGYDVTLATAMVFKDLTWLPSVGPLERLRNRLANRLYPELEPVHLRRIWWPEVLSSILKRGQFCSETIRHTVMSEEFDRLVGRQLRGFDVFHFSNGLGLISARKAKQAGQLVVAGPREVHYAQTIRLLKEEYALFGKEYPFPARRYLDRLDAELELVDYLIPQSSYSADVFAAQGFDRQRIRVVNHTISRFEPMPRSEDNTFRVVFAGYVAPAKGVHYLIEAFHALALPDAELVLMGHIDPVIQAKLPASERIVCPGRVPRDQLAEIYAKSSVFVFPSLTDAWGLAVIEAMSAGLPVIVTENTGAKDAVRPGIDGYIVPIRDSDALGNAIVKLYDDPNLRRTMGQNAAERAHEYTWPPYFKRLGQTYDEILGFG